MHSLLMQGVACKDKFYADVSLADLPPPLQVSFILRIFLRKGHFLQNHFCLVIRGLGVFHSWGILIN